MIVVNRLRRSGIGAPCWLGLRGRCSLGRTCARPHFWHDPPAALTFCSSKHHATCFNQVDDQAVGALDASTDHKQQSGTSVFLQNSCSHPPRTPEHNNHSSLVKRHESPVLCESHVRRMRNSEAERAGIRDLLEEREAQTGTVGYLVVQEQYAEPIMLSSSGRDRLCRALRG